MADGDIADLSWRAASAQVIVDDLDDPELSPDDLHHFSRVLRLRSGTLVCVNDGAGSWRFCSFTGVAGLEPLDDIRHEAAPESQLTVGFALVKGARPELVVQKLTEIGIDRIVLFAAERSVVRWDPSKAGKQAVRLTRVAREACAQSRRLRLPIVDIESAGALDGDGSDNAATFTNLVESGAVLAEVGGSPLTASDTAVLIGPEGGWNDREIGSAPHVALGQNILRAETAAITAGVLISALRSGLVLSAEVGRVEDLNHRE